MTDLLLTHGYFLFEDPKELQIMKPYAPLGILISLLASAEQRLRRRSVRHDIFHAAKQLFDTPANRNAVGAGRLREPDDAQQT